MSNPTEGELSLRTFTGVDGADTEASFVQALDDEGDARDVAVLRTIVPDDPDQALSPDEYQYLVSLLHLALVDPAGAKIRKAARAEVEEFGHPFTGSEEGNCELCGRSYSTHTNR